MSLGKLRHLGRLRLILGAHMIQSILILDDCGLLPFHLGANQVSRSNLALLMHASIGSSRTVVSDRTVEVASM
ncbi:hypothetical protein ACIBI8_39640 [Streptomyces sp. NPDC050529]|uniref:hypothetical protein n=1 Tax=unclassified Streptomyces TaxID=2593676 RepID=UPI002DD8C258|nr:hypothetical protein [Streptomyces sp. NBC_01022]WRZ79755.1 hypothetical protein OG316_05530 [Streptomyces sp. NBC_01022]